MLLQARSLLRAVNSSATAHDPDGDAVRGGLRLRGGIVAVRGYRSAGAWGGFAGGGGVANYGVNPTRLAPQSAAVVCAVEQDV
ncbi:MAG: hypothetical protein ACP5HM_07285 [Anaerolineae bacterium]